MVCAIWGRIPLMMQSAPISRAAVIVLMQMLRHQGVDRGHAGNVDNCDFGIGLHDRFNSDLHHYLGASAVQRADHGKRENSIPQLHHRSGKLQQLFLLTGDHLLLGRR